MTKYVYSATGEKLRTIYQTAVPNITVAVGTAHELTPSELLYTDSTDYYHGGKLTVKNGRLDKCYFDGGYAQASPAEVALNCKPSFFIFEEEGEIIIEDDNGNVIESSTVPSSNSQPSAPRPSTPLLYDPIYKSDEDVFAFYYYTADHLGNIREVINEDGAVEQTTNYYPFGTPFAEEAGNTNPDLQNHKYNGKEFDTMHGLNTYDYGARQYNSLLGRWDRMDPLCEKYYSISPYAYCANNPVMLIDFDGREPGQFFYTKDAAAMDFGFYYNRSSILHNREYASYIIKVVNKYGNAGYTYNRASIGGEDFSLPIKEYGDMEPVATIHSHGAYSKIYRNNEFSGLHETDEKTGKDIMLNDNISRMSVRSSKSNDISNANERGMISYLVTPNGTLQKYDPGNGSLQVVSTQMPSDPKDPDRKNNIIGNINIESLMDCIRIDKNINDGILRNMMRR